MKKARFFQAILIFLLIICTQSVRAQGEAEGVDVGIDDPERPRYRMELIWVQDGEGDRGEYVFAVGALGFKGVQRLKDFVALLPAGAILEWSPGCLRRGNEPLLSSGEELEDFRKFCQEHGVEFILHPSG